MKAMIKRQIQALAAGLCIGVIMQESIWVGLDAVDARYSLNQALTEAPLTTGWIVPLLLAWLAGGVFGGLMATLMGGNRLTGHIAGLLLSCSALLVTWLAMPGAGGLLVISLTPALGAVFGTCLGAALLGSKRGRPGLQRIVTLLGAFF